jgi:hypothetical protein
VEIVRASQQQTAMALETAAQQQQQLQQLLQQQASAPPATVDHESLSTIRAQLAEVAARQNAPPPPITVVLQMPSQAIGAQAAPAVHEARATEAMSLSKLASPIQPVARDDEYSDDFESLLQSGDVVTPSRPGQGKAASGAAAAGRAKPQPFASVPEENEQARQDDQHSVAKSVPEEIEFSQEHEDYPAVQQQQQQRPAQPTAPVQRQLRTSTSVRSIAEEIEFSSEQIPAAVAQVTPIAPKLRASASAHSIVEEIDYVESLPAPGPAAGSARLFPTVSSRSVPEEIVGDAPTSRKLVAASSMQSIVEDIAESPGGARKSGPSSGSAPAAEQHSEEDAYPEDFESLHDDHDVLAAFPQAPAPVAVDAPLPLPPPAAAGASVAAPGPKANIAEEGALKAALAVNDERRAELDRWRALCLELLDQRQQGRAVDDKVRPL